MKTYTICLIGLEQQLAVVIGGGKVAARKVTGLLEAGSPVVVISPGCVKDLESLHAANRIRWINKTYEPGDLGSLGMGANSLVIAATDEAQTNHQVWQEATGLGCLVNVVDDPEHSNFIMPAILRRGDVSLAVSTGGASPALARWIREDLEEKFGEEVGILAEIMGELRPDLIAGFDSSEARRRAAVRLIESGILELIRSQGADAARKFAASLIKEERL